MAVEAKFTVRFGFSLEPEMRKYISNLSNKWKMSEGAVIRHIIDEWRERNDKVGSASDD